MTTAAGAALMPRSATSVAAGLVGAEVADGDLLVVAGQEATRASQETHTGPPALNPSTRRATYQRYTLLPT